MKLTWLGHASFHIQTAGLDVVIDPFFTGNPKFPAGYEDRISKIDILVLTHGHADHFADAVRLAKKYNPQVFGQYELIGYMGSQGLDKLQPMNTGGTVDAGNGVDVTMVNASHASSFSDGNDAAPTYMGVANGVVLRGPDKTLYHAGDTDVFSDMALIQRLYAPKIGLIPIGDRFTMGPEGAALACNEFLDLETIIPIHWGTFELLTGTPDQFAALLQRGQMLVPTPGETVTL